MKPSILGMGVISALGNSIAETRVNIFQETPRLPALPTRFNTTLPLPVFEVPGLIPDPYQPGNVNTQLLKIALNEALDNAAISIHELQQLRVGVAIGTTVGTQLNNIPYYAQLRADQASDGEPLKSYVNGHPAEWVRRTYNLHGPAITVSNACASGADAIGIGMLWLEQDVCDLVIVGGTDELNKVPFVGFNALGVCSTSPCRPFDANRSGLNLGEAAGVLILSKAKQTPRHVIGYGKTADAFHITSPATNGVDLERAIQIAITQAGIAIEDIAFINAHGTGTQANDLVEATVFHRLLPQGIPFMSTKGMTGHTLGAAGAIEAIFSIIMLEEQKAARSIRFETQSADIPISPLKAPMPLHHARYALSTSLAFGGSNSALILSLE